MTEPSDEYYQLRQRIYDLERQLRSVQLYGVAYLLKHGKDHMELAPWDVTVVFAAGQPTTDLELRSLVVELEQDKGELTTLERVARQHLAEERERIRKAREALQDCAHDSDGMCGYGQRALAVLDGEGEKEKPND